MVLRLAALWAASKGPLEFGLLDVVMSKDEGHAGNSIGFYVLQEWAYVISSQIRSQGPLSSSLGKQYPGCDRRYVLDNQSGTLLQILSPHPNYWGVRFWNQSGGIPLTGILTLFVWNIRST